MKKLVLFSMALLSMVLFACGSSKPMAMAMANLVPTGAAGPTGMVHFHDQADGSTEVMIDIKGLDPHSVHGLHVHQNPSCADNGNAAGGHFNPTGMQHGGPMAAMHHSGDFGNVKADDKGEVHEHFNTRAVTAHAGDLSVLGHSVVLHGGPDDLTSQPAGNSGPRIACGVVEAMVPGMKM